MGTYEDFNSPYGVARSIHPGAVLLSPQLSSTSTSTPTPITTTTNNNNINNLSNAFNNLNIINNNKNNNNGNTHTNISNISNTLIDDTNNSNQSIINSHLINNNANSNTSNSNDNNSHNINFHNNNNNNMMTAGSVSNNNNNNGLINLTQDINNICKWLTNMSSAQQNMVMDNIISILKDDVLQYTKLKLDSLTNSGYLSSPPQPPIITSPLSVPLLNELNLSNNRTTSDSIYHPWSPQPILEQQQQHQARLLQQRPKSADPSSYQFQQQTNDINSMISSSLRNENSNSGNNRHLNIHNHSNYITSEKNISTSPNQYQNQNQNHVSYHRSLNNRKVYSDSQYQQPYSYQSTGLHSYNNFYSFTKAHQNKHRHTDDNLSNSNLQHQKSLTTTSNNTSMNPKNLTDPSLLLDIPMWLKSLRLHKYSTILKDYYWEDLIELNDDFLNNKGVVALGARRKLLKAFTIVKDLKNLGEIDQKAFIRSNN